MKESAIWLLICIGRLSVPAVILEVDIALYGTARRAKTESLNDLHLSLSRDKMLLCVKFALDREHNTVEKLLC